MAELTRWERIVQADPDHSTRYIDRFKAMAARGFDLDGEARAVDALVERGARILDVGCGPGRVSVALAQRGHRVYGIDIDPVLIAEAERVARRSGLAPAGQAGGVGFVVGDICAPYPPAVAPADLIVCAGNVITFLDGDTPAAALAQMAAGLAPGGRVAMGFGLGRGYPMERFTADCAAAGLAIEARFSTWQFHPFTAESQFVVALLARG